MSSAQVAQLAGQREQLVGEVEAVRGLLLQRDGEADTLRWQLKQKGESLRQLAGQVADLQQLVEGLKQRATRQQGTTQALEAEVAAGQAREVGLRSELAAAAAQATSAAQAREQAQAEAERQRQGIQAQLKQLHAKNAQLQRDRDVLRAAHHEQRPLRHKEAALQAALDARSTELGAAAARQEELAAELERRAEIEAELRRALAAAEQETASLRGRASGLTAQNDSLRLALLNGAGKGGALPSYLNKPSAVVQAPGCKITAPSAGLTPQQQVHGRCYWGQWVAPPCRGHVS